MENETPGNDKNIKKIISIFDWRTILQKTHQIRRDAQKLDCGSLGRKNFKLG
jgi:hypothetical protein